MDTAASAEVRDTAERPDVWVVYLPEWLIFYTSQGRGYAGWEETWQWFREHYAGKIRTKDWRIVTPDGVQGAGSVRETHHGRWRLQLFVPNLKGLLRDRAEADKLASELGQDAEVVARFSAQERKLLRYGKSLIREQ